MKIRPLSAGLTLVMLCAVATATSVQAFSQPSAEPASAAVPVDCTPAPANPTTDNVADYRLDTNVVAPGRWSYQSVSGNATGLLGKGGSGVFAADEWAADVKKPEHAWFVKADGSIGTDDRAISETYTVADQADGKNLHLSGTFESPGGRFRVLLAHDGDSAVTAGPFTELYTYTGKAASFDLDLVASKGDDLLFVSDQVTTWWVPGKLKATITTELAPQTATVTATPGPGAIRSGNTVQLASATKDACIRYTTDGSDPNSSTTAKPYRGPIAITADTGLKTVAAATGSAPSVVADLPFVLNEPFRAFAGENQGTQTGLVAGVQWDRMDFDWGSIEPAKGQIDQAALAEYVRQFTLAKSHGITILPVLGYTAGWAANRTGYSYEFHGKTYVYGPVKSENNGQFTRQLVTKDAHGNVLSTKDVQTSIGRTPPQNPDDWKSFVKLAVDTLKPLGITYFQVWNEAYPGSGFWEGGMDQYMTDIQLPAAKIIHDNGVKLVYGGWICGAPLSEYIALLDKYKAWQGIDVYDVHYMPIGTMQTIYAAAQKRGIKNPAVWQTELGFTTEDKFVADIYPRVFHWALSKGGNDLDRFKLLYFAEWSPDDPAAYGYNRTLRSGNNLSPKGKTLVTLANLLRGAKAETYDNFTTTPELKPELNEALSTANGFRLDDKRLVLAIDLKRQNQANIFEDPNTGDTIHLGFGEPTMTVTLKDVRNVKSLDRVDLYGNRTPLQWKSSGHDTIQVEVPIIDPDPIVKALNQTEQEDVFYLSLVQN
ncbi:chitobiase/beta-hexosaminidase C-terminal domain-containing protein [Kribbella kalugense]|uniref:Chitobiase/beta-hexosaminidase-like protein n=1 Tax=Kribbella kalugense TaxID=2512221 RepID=A0A4R7ZF84_9ACTN|nr:chitobiase/beta-hexosaminidase C-terminal domain-containing protein [Kribbella kalugense]TDW14931.1 chitobiase/beta-hexosaminidase-like protein [Kribbella kalugense]